MLIFICTWNLQCKYTRSIKLLCNKHCWMMAKKGNSVINFRNNNLKIFSSSFFILIKWFFLLFCIFHSMENFKLNEKFFILYFIHRAVVNCSNVLKIIFKFNTVSCSVIQDVQLSLHSKYCNENFEIINFIKPRMRRKFK